MTAAALMIGVALVVFVAVFVNGFKESFLGAIDRSVDQRPDHPVRQLHADPRARPCRRLAAAPGVQTATGIQSADAKVNNGGTDTVNGVDPKTFAKVYKFDWLNGGSNRLLTGLGPDQALIEKQFAKSHKLKDGDTLPARPASTATTCS